MNNNYDMTTYIYIYIYIYICVGNTNLVYKTYAYKLIYT